MKKNKDILFCYKCGLILFSHNSYVHIKQKFILCDVCFDFLNGKNQNLKKGEKQKMESIIKTLEEKRKKLLEKCINLETRINLNPRLELQILLNDFNANPPKNYKQRKNAFEFSRKKINKIKQLKKEIKWQEKNIIIAIRKHDSIVNDLMLLDKNILALQCEQKNILDAEFMVSKC